MQKIRVAVLRGGPSEEYSVSMKTGQSVLEALEDSPDFTPIDVTITRQGEWLVGGYPRHPRQVLETVDLAFLALHGAYGEDGTVQRTLDRFGVPYTGSRAYPSSVAMNKILTKEHIYDLPVQSAPHMRVTNDKSTDVPRVAHRLEELLGEECVIKPVSGGSSINTHIARGAGELTRALNDIFAYYDDALVEKRIRGTEATCTVVERFRDHDMYTLPVIEIALPAEAFFDNAAKYSGETDEICPGRFTETQKREIADCATQIHRTLGLSQYSRSDFIVAEDLPGQQAGGIYFLEVNTLPGMTKESLVPKGLEAVGCSYRDFIHHLLLDARAAAR